MEPLIQFTAHRVAVYATGEQLETLFSNEFMGAYTNFQTFEEFRFSGAVFVDWNADFITGSKEAFDGCVRGKTAFDTWEEMYCAALAYQSGRRG